MLLFVLYVPYVVSANSTDLEPVETTDYPVIFQLQTGSNSSASSEYILLFNPSTEDIDITNWCLVYRSASGITSRQLACITAQDDQTELWLSAGGLVSFASDQFTAENPLFVADFSFSSGMSSTGGHVYLVDQQDVEIDRVGWGSATLPETSPAAPHQQGEVLSRNIETTPVDTDDNSVDFVSSLIPQLVESGLYEQTKIVDLCSNIDGVQIVMPDGFLADNSGDCYEDFCPQLEGLQLQTPDGYEKLPGANVCSLIPLEDAVIFITELLPNAPSVDTGQEFIELYNPNKSAVDLSGYELQLGPSYTKSYTLGDVSIASQSYIVLSDTLTKLTLPNASGVALRLYAAAGNLVDETTVYNNADDSVSWALVEDQWIYTNQITPGSANKPYLELAVDEVLGVTSVLAPCSAGKFRNPATNRCKNIETAVSQLVPCDADEFRNPTTNRCNKTASAASSLAPCAAGKTRNPATNRCRNIVGLSLDGSLPLVSDIPVESTAGTANWLLMISSITAAAGYMVYEWRSELVHGYGRLRRRT